MKVLMPVLHYYPVIGGLENWTQNIAERLSDKAEIFVITGKVKNQPAQEVKNGVNVFRTSLFSLKNLSYSSPFYILTALPFIFFKSRNFIKKEKIGLLHCQGFLSSFLGYLLSKIYRIPYIVTVQRQESKKWHWLKTRVYKNAKFCIAASWFIRKEYFEKIGVKNVEVIPNGIDLERFKNLNRQESRRKLGFNGERIIMTVGRLEKVKGIDYLIKAMTMGELPKINYRLLIIGEGSEGKNLESLAEKLGLKDRVKFLGQIPNKRIPEHLVAADCFVFPSLSEGFGIAVLEARAAGLPIVATTRGGVVDIVQGGIHGLPINPENPQSISDCIFRILSEEGLAQELAQKARAGLEKYDWQNIVLEVFKIYENYYRHTNLPS